MHSSYEVFGFVISAIIHLAVVAAFWTGTLSSNENPETKTTLQLSMFKIQQPEVKKAVEVAQLTKPKPKPESKPNKPKPKAKPKLKPKPKPKPKLKPKLKPKKAVKEFKPKPEVKPEPVIAEEPQETEVTKPSIKEKPIGTQTVAAPAAAVKRLNPQPATLLEDTGYVARVEEQYKAELRQLIDSLKRYPRRAQRRKQEGKATVSFVIDRNGTVENIEILQSTGFDTLDQAVINAIESISGQLPLPEAINRNRWKFKIPLSFRLS